MWFRQTFAACRSASLSTGSKALPVTAVGLPQLRRGHTPARLHQRGRADRAHPPPIGEPPEPPRIAPALVRPPGMTCSNRSRTGTRWRNPHRRLSSISAFPGKHCHVSDTAGTAADDPGCVRPWRTTAVHHAPTVATLAGRPILHPRSPSPATNPLVWHPQRT